MKKSLLLFLSSFILFSACRKDEIDTTVTTTDPPIAEDFYTKKVYGIVVDEDGLPIAGAFVQLNNNTVSTAPNGLFEFSATPIGNVQGNFLRVEKNGYFDSGRRLRTSGEASAFYRIQLMSRNAPIIINASDGGEVRFDGDHVLNFQAGSFEKNGQAFSGNVRVYARYLDPTSEDFLFRTPGDLTGRNTEGQTGILTSYGMVAVELEDDNGSKLTLVQNKPATVRMKLPTALLNRAPENIPLWHFDEDRGLWMEEGSAQLEGGYYVGAVSHFSWWNCDDFAQGTNLCIQLTTSSEQNNLEGIKILLETDNLAASSGITDGDGLVCGLVPAGTTIQITIYDLCGGIIYEGEIGPFPAGNAALTIEVNTTDLSAFAFTGKIFECDGITPVDGAIVRIHAEKDFYTVSGADGTYSAYIIACSPEIDYSILALNLAAGTSGSATGTADGSEVVTNDISTCAEQPFITITSPSGPDFLSNSVRIRVKPFETLLLADGSTSSEYFLAGFAGTSPGEYDVTVIGSVGGQNPKGKIFITEFGAVGEMVKGTIEYSDNGNGQFLSTGTFVAFREE